MLSPLNLQANLQADSGQWPGSADFWTARGEAAAMPQNVRGRGVQWHSIYYKCGRAGLEVFGFFAWGIWI